MSSVNNLEQAIRSIHMAQEQFIDNVARLTDRDSEISRLEKLLRSCLEAAWPTLSNPETAQLSDIPGHIKRIVGRGCNGGEPEDSPPDPGDKVATHPMLDLGRARQEFLDAQKELWQVAPYDKVSGPLNNAWNAFAAVLRSLESLRTERDGLLRKVALLEPLLPCGSLAT